jgi:hypothetical protein
LLVTVWFGLNVVAAAAAWFVIFSALCEDDEGERDLLLTNQPSAKGRTKNSPAIV